MQSGSCNQRQVLEHQVHLAVVVTLVGLTPCFAPGPQGELLAAKDSLV